MKTIPTKKEEQKRKGQDSSTLQHAEEKQIAVAMISTAIYPKNGQNSFKTRKTADKFINLSGNLNSILSK